MQRRKFSREFKLEAVRLIKDRGVAAAQAARDLDLHENVLRKWVREVLSSAGRRRPEPIFTIRPSLHVRDRYTGVFLRRSCHSCTLHSPCEREQRLGPEVSEWNHRQGAVPLCGPDLGFAPWRRAMKNS